MKKESKGSCLLSALFLGAFAVWTVLVRIVDVRPIGPMGSEVGLAALNGLVHRFFGVHMELYAVTDLLSVIPLLTVVGFGFLGLVQWIRRGDLRRVDGSILALGVFYIVTLALFAAFEVLALNYRPILIEGVLEASYPSSTTMLASCVMPTALIQLRMRVKSRALRVILSAVITAFTAFMVIGRLVSGVHWLSDIIGGALLSVGLVAAYYSLCAAIGQGDRP